MYFQLVPTFRSSLLTVPYSLVDRSSPFNQPPHLVSLPFQSPTAPFRFTHSLIYIHSLR